MFNKGTTGTPSYRNTLRANRSRHLIRNGLVLVALGLFAGAAALALSRSGHEVTLLERDRVALEADTIGGYHIPAGATIYVSLYATHRLPSLWPDPDRFDPERFTPEAEVWSSTVSVHMIAAGSCERCRRCATVTAAPQTMGSRSRPGRLNFGHDHR